MIQQLISILSIKDKILLEKLYYQCLTQAEIAKQYNISQQAENQWKRRELRKLSMTMKC